MRLTQGGNVGIGITSPSTTLHVNGDTNIQHGYHSTNFRYTFTSSTQVYARIGYLVGYAEHVFTCEANNYVGEVRLVADASTWINGATSIVPFTITYNNGSGINNPVMAFYIITNQPAIAYATPEIWVQLRGNSGTYVQHSFRSMTNYDHGVTTGVGLGTAASAVAASLPGGYTTLQTYTMNQGGGVGVTSFMGQNVGIGNTSPGSPLTISKTGDGDLIQLKATSNIYTGSSVNILFMNTNNQYPLARILGIDSQPVFNSAFQGDLAFQTGLNQVLYERMRINYVGNVGIGRADPVQKLEVLGHIALGHRWNGTTSFDPIYLGKPDANGNFGGGSAYIAFMDSSADGVNKGTSIGIITHQWGVATSERVRIAGNGNVGINTTSPGYTLHVNGSAFFSSGGLNGSDSRIKTNITPADTTNALNQINAIELKRYEYKDKVLMHNENTVYGVIAQQVKEVLPEAVQFMTNMIPSVMQTSSAFTIETTETEEKEGQEPTFKSLTALITLPQPHNLPSSGTNKVRICNQWSNDGVPDEVYEEVPCEIISDTEIRVTLTKPVFKDLTSVFVYGHEVDDFHAVDKSKIFMPLIGAVQELSKENTQLKVELATLKAFLASKFPGEF